ncbi:unnamed protein product (macronuclear) [Paramecium tetraurelia]|uniref:Uncharacterized protein n=1 Tax=Paramecium tetraurelia TaxID=5888 RepID=A0CP84_PARTE|nr:uncharacterized protein GSPATT00008992001 [Paramecium tetraurelia]CAK72601.1 unnamed protein product [Paramecium tetraurelia]|eukprot:XP_001439998.1 hypothetical protein (macronuclear) [Paramecium tetraurelia strain d4-2]
MNQQDFQLLEEKKNNQIYGLDQIEKERLNFLWGLCHKGDLTINNALQIMEEEKGKEEVWVDQQIQEKTQKLKNLRVQFEDFSKVNEYDATSDIENIDLSIRNIEDQLQNNRKWNFDQNSKLTLQSIEKLNNLVSQKDQLIVQRNLEQFKDTCENQNYLNYLLKYQQINKNISQKYQFYKKLQVLKRIEQVYASGFNHDGNILVTSSSEGLYFWEFSENNYTYLCNLWTATLQVGILFSKFQDLLITYDLLGQFGIVKMINGKWKLEQLIQGHQDSICSIMLQQNDSQIITASQKNGIKFWYLNTFNNWSCQYNFEFNSNYLSYVTGNNGNYLVSGTFDGNISIWQYQDINIEKIIIKKFQRILNAHQRTINNITFINQQKFSSLSYQSEIKIWEQSQSNYLFNQKQVIKFNGLNYWSVFTSKLTYIHHQNLLFCCTGNQIKIFKLNRDGKFDIMTEIIKEKEIYAFSVTQDGKLIAYSNPISLKLIIKQAIEIQ